MINKKSIKLVLLIIGLLPITLLFSKAYYFNNLEIKNNINLYPFNNLKQADGFWTLSPISINGNDAWASIAAANDWCTGSGSPNDPYLIENVTINGSGSGSCINISNSDVYFIVNNCTLYNSQNSEYHGGISLTNTNNGELLNNNCSFNYIGIRLLNSSYNSIIGNIVSHAGFMGIRTSNSDYNNISRNIASYNSLAGIAIGGDYNHISENIVISSHIGLYMKYSSFCTVTKNSLVSNGGSGLELASPCNENNFFNNVFDGNNLHVIDGGTTNYYNSSEIGNKWDDYVGNDINDDGIGDTPYTVHGLPLKYDYLPIFEDGDDIAPPVLKVISPKDKSIINSPRYEIYTRSLYIDTMWYNLNYSSNTHTFSELSGQLDQTEWDQLDESNLTITFYANDSLGNLGSTTISVEKDITLPILTLLNPKENEIYGVDPPYFNITVIDKNILTYWYTLDGGLTNLTFNINGSIDHTEWEDKANGTIGMYFYAKDSAGNIGDANVNIKRDIIAPIITIDLPTINQQFKATAPNFAINIVEGNLDNIWYTLDNETTNYSCGFSGQINQTFWDSLPDGNYIIRFYANDTLGNQGFNDVIIIKSDSESYGISGYEIITFLGIIFVLIFTITKIEYRKKNIIDQIT